MKRTETARLSAEPMTEIHLPGLLRLFQDERVTPTLTATGKPLSKAEVMQMVKKSEAHWDAHRWGPWAFLEKETGDFVGRGGLRAVILEGRETVEVGYALLPAFWGRGFATEMVRESVRVGFEVLGLPELVAYTLETNFASQNVLQKAGFVFDKPITHAGLPHFLYRQINSMKEQK